MSQRNTFFARIVDRYCLNKAGSSRETWHIVLEAESSFPSFRPGDSIGIYPKNAAEDVKPLLSYFQLQDEDLVADKRGVLHPAFSWFQNCVDIRNLTRAFLEVIAQHICSDSPLLTSLLKGEIPLRNYDLFRILSAFPHHKMPLQACVPALSSLRPRLYSIASAPTHGEKTVELIVARVLYEIDGVMLRGVCSNYLIEEAPMHQSSISFFHQKTPHFLFPEEDVPLIMVGAGTGIAPFRAYMQEVVSKAEKLSKCWLFFGERKSTADFFYEEFWKKHLGEGRLRLNLAFSCDQEHKIYVQHRMWEERSDIWSWLQEGAHFRVCGHAQKMAKDVEKCLFDIARDEGRMKEDQAYDWLSSLKEKRRYLKDVY